MPRNMSFMLTVEQFEDGSKDVTRRKGWLHLKPGDTFHGVRKAMGLRKGEKIERLQHAKGSLCRCISNDREPLNAITPEDVIREGFPGKTPEWFVAMYCKHNGGGPDQPCSRIVFEHIEEPQQDILGTGFAL